jgi:hypothetical protein
MSKLIKLSKQSIYNLWKYVLERYVGAQYKFYP